MSSEAEVSSLDDVIYPHVPIEGTKSSSKQTIDYMTGYVVAITFVRQEKSLFYQ